MQGQKDSDRLEGQSDDEDLAEVMELVEEPQTDGKDLEIPPAENLEETNVNEDSKGVPKDAPPDLQKHDDQDMPAAEEASGSGVFCLWV